MRSWQGWVAAAAVVVATSGTDVRAEVRAIASIKPIHALVAGVMEGVAEPALLMEGAGSPHTYSLRPSDAAALEDAQVVFWVGAGLETFLVKPLDALAADARVVALAETEGLTLLPTREGGAWDGPPDEEDARQQGRGGIDMHLWLDPRNARVMVERIATVLSEVAPAHAEAFAANAAAYDERLAELDREIAARLAPVADRPFVVFHDAYQYFEARYDLNAVGTIAVGPERRPGARRLAGIRDRLAGLDAACVFAEPQFEPSLVRTVVEGTGARTGTLDPVGAAIDAGADHYPTLLESLADALAQCLGDAAG